MIATERFVYLHLHKSGGTFVNRFLLEWLPTAQRIGYHLPRSQIPPELRSLPVLGTVRNPWEYYVSWYSFQAAMETPNALFSFVSAGRTLDFPATLRNLLALPGDVQRLEELVRKMPETFPGRGLNLTQQCLQPWAGSTEGFYSFLYQRMFVPGSSDVLLRTDEIRHALPAALQDLGVVVTPAMRDYLAQAPALNRSPHSPYQEYYDPSLQALVAERDAGLIARHGFKFAGNANR